MISLKKTLTKLCELGTGACIAGKVIAYAGSDVPRGWLLCNGQAVSRSDFSALFAAIGTTYGSGDGSTTFNVPDLTGRVVVGQNPNDTDTTETLGKLGAIGGKRGAWYHSHSSIKLVTQDSTDRAIGQLVYSSSSTNTGYSGDSNNQLIATKANMPPYMVLNYLICTGENFSGSLQRPAQTADYVTSVGADGTRTWNSGIVDNYNTYSTSEQRIGKWVDGRTLYRRTLTGVLPSSKDTIYPLKDTYLSLCNSYGLVRGQIGSMVFTMPINSYFGSNTTNQIRVIQAGNEIAIQYGSQFYNYSYQITIEYIYTNE